MFYVVNMEKKYPKKYPKKIQKKIQKNIQKKSGFFFQIFLDGRSYSINMCNV